MKGQLHAHTNGSGDSDTPPAQAARWYAQRGYDFVVFTDHNRVTELPSTGGMLVLRGVEITQNRRDCEPSPPFPYACLLHVNALFLTQSVQGASAQFRPAPASLSRKDIYGFAVDMSQALGGIAQLNHPNFHLAADAGILESLVQRGLLLVEIANQAEDSNNEGDDEHPSTEAMWDAVLSRGYVVFGTATDDAHHYDDAEQARARGEIAYTGDRGFVMVRAEKNVAAIRQAIQTGDFYASTGVLLGNLEMSASTIALDVQGTASHSIEVIGQGGAVLQRIDGTHLRFDPKTAPAGYIRVRVCESDQQRCAWTQPYFSPPTH